MESLPDLLWPHYIAGSGTHVRTLEVVLEPGDAIIAATVTAVDPKSLSPLTDTLQIVGDAAGTTTTLPYALIASDDDGDHWGVNLYLKLGSAQMYWLKLAWRTASQPGADQYPIYYRVEARN
jgi:hypothetical protein